MVVDFESIWANLPFPALVLGEDDRVVSTNPAAESLIGSSSRQLQGRRADRIFGEGSPVADTILQARQKCGSLMQYNAEVSLPPAPPLVCNLHVGPIRAAETGLLLLIQPAGVVQKMRQSLTHVGAARSVRAMAAMLAHELRNPLAGISGAAQLLALNVSGQDRELTELIEEEIRRIGTLIDRVEHFADDRPLVRGAINIHDVLERAVRSAQVGFGQGIAFHGEYDPSLPVAAGDADQLMQVFQNLLKNAAEAVTPGRGCIRIRTSYNSGVKVCVAGQDAERLPLQIEIIDNGRGIPEGMIGDIFAPFVTSKSNGTGLGLPLVSKIIAGHGGLVECDSEDGRTVFTVRLPVWQN
ncbi:MAG: PAS domain-containing protein [Rhodobacteraceae bacterium]|nr:PAS domain-containing protein [Paracoccaceae bacterium]